MQLIARYHEALERIATLDGIKGFNETDIMTASSQLFSLVCKLKNIAKDALEYEEQSLEAPLLTGVIDPEMVP